MEKQGIQEETRNATPHISRAPKVYKEYTQNPTPQTRIA